MPRLRLGRRRPQDVLPKQTEDLPGNDEYEQSFAPFVPVEPAGIDPYQAEETEPVDAPAPTPRRVRRLPSLRPGWRRPTPAREIRPSALLLAVALIVGGIVATLVLQERLDLAVDERWPFALLALTGLWMLIALVQREPTPFLGGAALAGVGVALLLDAEAVAVFGETVLGIVLVTVGLGIVIRGLLMRESPA